MSGWWSNFSASAATWLTNSGARRNDGNCQERTSMSPCRSHPLAVGIRFRISGSLSLAMKMLLRVGIGGVGVAGDRVGHREVAIPSDDYLRLGTAEQGRNPRVMGVDGHDGHDPDPGAVLRDDRRGEPAGRGAALGDRPDAHEAPDLPERVGGRD